MPTLISGILLPRLQRLLLDDGEHFIRAFAILLSPKDAAITEGIFRLRCQQRHRRFLRKMEVPQALDDFSADERSVSGEDENVVVLGERGLADHDGVSGAPLLFLEDEAATDVGSCGANAVGLESNDGVDVRDGNDLGGGLDDPAQERFAADFVEHLGVPGFEARAFSRGHDGDGDPRRIGFRSACRHWRDITGRRE